MQAIVRGPFKRSAFRSTLHMEERIGTANEGRMSYIAYAIHEQEVRVTVAPVCRAFWSFGATKGH